MRKWNFALVGLLTTASLIGAGCSYQFGENTPDVPLLGDPPSMSSFPLLNDKPAQDALFVRGADNAYWVSIREFQAPGAIVTGDEMLTVKRLSPPEQVEKLQAHHVYVSYFAFYLVRPNADPTMPTQLLIHPAGARMPDDSYLFPPGEPLMRPGGDLLKPPGAGAVSLYYWVLSKDTKSFDVVHRNPFFRRQLPAPAGANPLHPLDAAEIFFSPAGDLIFTRDATGHMAAHSTTALKDTDLGVRPVGPIIDRTRKALIFCGQDGLRSVPFDGSMEKVLDPGPCDPQGTRFDGQTLLYLVNKNSLVAVSPALRNVQPAVMRPQTYWNAEWLYLTPMVAQVKR